MNYKRNIKSGKFEQIYTVNSDFFDNIGEIQSYLLVLYSVDGSISKNNSISISQSHKNGYELLYDHNFDSIHTSNAKYFLYKDVKLKAIQMLKEGKKVKDISKILAIKPTVIWNWKYRKL